MSPRPLSDQDYRTLARFRRALRTFTEFSAAAARDAGLTPAQHQLLLAVRGFDGDGQPSVGDLAEALGLKLHSAGELVGRAQSAGLVAKSHDPADHRRTQVTLTDRGHEVLEHLSHRHRQELRRFVTDFGDLLGLLDGERSACRDG